MKKLVPLADLPLTGKDWYLLAVASMEQLMGGALSTIAGIIIPLILLLGTPELSAFEQGLLGASGLMGIAIGSVIIGRLMDSIGYLFLFRLCPLIIAVGSVAICFSHSVPPLVLSLFCMGIGVGGGYTLDSGYISEIMPRRWESFMVGLAKASSSLGFVGGAAVGYFVLLVHPSADVWPWLMLFVGALALLTFICRLRWYQSPAWLMAKGRTAQAQAAAQAFMGPEAEILPAPRAAEGHAPDLREMFSGVRLQKVMLSGVSWACEGLGVYGFGVFLPILLMALGMQDASAHGIPKILDSVGNSAFINIFIGVGFGLGLAILHRVNIIRLMGYSFILCALALAMLLAAYRLGLAAWVSFASFVIFEIALNAGPHLVTYIIPSHIYGIEERGIGTGIATLFGKVGAVLGVFFMPILLDWGGVALVLWVSIIVQLLGAAVTFYYGKSLKLL